MTGGMVAELVRLTESATKDLRPGGCPGINMNLVSSLGGPLIAMSHRALPHWDGSDPPTDGRVIDVRWQDDHSIPATDYGRACAIPDVGILAVGEFEALVLSGKGNNTVWLIPDAQGRGRLFLTQLWVNDVEQFHTSIESLVDYEFPKSARVAHSRFATAPV